MNRKASQFNAEAQRRKGAEPSHENLIGIQGIAVRADFAGGTPALPRAERHGSAGVPPAWSRSRYAVPLTHSEYYKRLS